MDKSKPFGLIITKKSKSFRPTTSAVFGSDSDDDQPTQKKMPKIPQAKPIKAEPCEDPSIYEYDSVYDDMKAKEVAKIAPKEANKPSKYIESLLKAADKRKKDQERRVEKKVHHEREKEGDKFKDKEAFVTSSYKKKMEEMEQEEERERRENMLNDMMDVTKQKDLNGFYRHFLKQCVGEETVPVFGERYSVKQEDGVAIKEEKVSDEEAAKSKPVENIDQDSDMSSSSDENEQNTLKSFDDVDKVSRKSLIKDGHGKRNSDRNYRRNVSNAAGKVTEKNCPEKESLHADDVDRDSDSSSSEEECQEKSPNLSKSSSKKNVDEDVTKKRKRSPDKSRNIRKRTEDDDSDDSEDECPEKSPDLNKSSSKKNVDEDVTKKRKRSPEKSRNIRKRSEDDDLFSEESVSGAEDEKTRSKKKNDAEQDSKMSSNSEGKDVAPRKSREDIFAKRTIGELFAEAQARYFQRMAARS